MTSNQMAIAGLTTCTVLVGALALRNSRTERGNRALFERTGELRAKRSRPAVLLALALFISALAFAADHGDHGRTWGLALVGTLVTLYGWFTTLFSVRLEQDAMRFGLSGHRRVAYPEIAGLVRVTGPRRLAYVLALKSGERVTVGEGLACEALFVEELRRRAGCEVVQETAGTRMAAGA